MAKQSVAVPDGFPEFKRQTAKEWRSRYSTKPKAECVNRLESLETERIYHQERQRDLTREQEALNVRLARIAREEIAAPGGIAATSPPE